MVKEVRSPPRCKPTFVRLCDPAASGGPALLLWMRFYARRVWKGRSIFGRATENGPAFCECFVCTNKYTAVQVPALLSRPLNGPRHLSDPVRRGCLSAKRFSRTSPGRRRTFRRSARFGRPLRMHSSLVPHSSLVRPTFVLCACVRLSFVSHPSLARAFVARSALNDVHSALNVRPSFAAAAVLQEFVCSCVRVFVCSYVRLSVGPQRDVYSASNNSCGRSSLVRRSFVIRLLPVLQEFDLDERHGITFPEFKKYQERMGDRVRQRHPKTRDHRDDMEVD